MKNPVRFGSLAGCLLLAAVLLCQACNPAEERIGTPDAAQVMQTVVFLQTLAAGQTQAVQPSASGTPEGPIHTQTPTSTHQTSAFFPTPTVTPCLDLDYIGDVSIPDGTVFYSLQPFTKTWQVKNVGTCTWTTDYALVFVSGESMEGPARVNLPVPVNPGETIELSVALTAPSRTGTHSGYWMLQSDHGINFGYGENHNLTWWVKIQVAEYAFYSDPIPEPLDGLNYDFAAAICEAEWTSSFEPPTVPCAGYLDVQPAWAALLTAPLLEGNNLDNERTLWFHPDGQRGHWLTGTFPAYLVQPDDHFTAVIGCLEMSPMCDVSMTLEYVEDGATYLLESWQEVNDGLIQAVDVDLSPLAGRNVQFQLTVSGNTNASDPNAFWLVPAISSLP